MLCGGTDGQPEADHGSTVLRCFMIDFSSSICANPETLAREPRKQLYCFDLDVLEVENTVVRQIATIGEIANSGDQMWRAGP